VRAGAAALALRGAGGVKAAWWNGRGMNWRVQAEGRRRGGSGVPTGMALQSAWLLLFPPPFSCLFMLHA